MINFLALLTVTIGIVVVVVGRNLEFLSNKPTKGTLHSNGIDLISIKHERENITNA